MGDKKSYKYMKIYKLIGYQNMKSYKHFKNEEQDEIMENFSISKLKRLKLVDDGEFNMFLRIMKKMDGNKPMPIKEKDIVMKVFKNLVDAITSNMSLFQKVVKRDQPEPDSED